MRLRTVRVCKYFNPRSLAGATNSRKLTLFYCLQISIHAPSRERLCPNDNLDTDHRISIHAPSRERHAKHQEFLYKYCDFNPRSLAGATSHDAANRRVVLFQSTLPRGSDSIKMMYFYNYVNQAFVANKLN